METKTSLALDVEAIGYGKSQYPVGRIAVVGMHGITRDGSAPTITRDCRAPAELKREVDRLRAELDNALERAGAALGGKVVTRADRSAGQPVPSVTGTAPNDTPALHLQIDARVSDLMTREVQTVSPNDSLSVAKDAMEAGRFRHLVVVGDEGEVLGVLSQRDFFFGPLAWSLGQGQRAYEALLTTSRIKDVMHADVITVDASTSLQEAASMLAERKIGCLPVVEASQLVGVITEGDFVRLVATSAPLPS